MKPTLVQILVVVANIQVRLLKTEVEKGDALEPSIVSPTRLVCHLTIGQARNAYCGNSSDRSVPQCDNPSSRP